VALRQSHGQGRADEPGAAGDQDAPGRVTALGQATDLTSLDCPAVSAAPVAIITALAAAVRFATLDAQSFWYDEALTVDLVGRSFGDMLSGVFDGQAQPPTYFILAWLWAHVFGDGEVGLRALSALVGTLTVPVAYMIGAEVAGRRTAIFAGLFTALSPALVWYSQEARSYALLVFFAALALLFLVRGLERDDGRQLAWWVAASLLAVVSHYFALFAVLPQAAWLLWAKRKAAWPALAGLAVGLAAIAPMLLYQQERGGVDWIGELPLWPRVRDAVFLFAVGPTGFRSLPDHREAVFAAGVAAFAVAVAVALAWSAGPVRRRVLLMLAVVGAVTLIPLLATTAGSDYVLDRNFLAAWVPAAVIGGVALAVLPWPRLAAVAAALACLLFAAITVAAVPRNPDRQRDDWRGVAELVGPPTEPRVFVISPRWQSVSLGVYRPGLAVMERPEAVRKVVTVELEGFVPFGGGVTTIAPPPPFRETRFTREQNLTVVEYTAPAPVRLDPKRFFGGGSNGGEAFLERPPPPGPEE
jgi:mannosyltransferase